MNASRALKEASLVIAESPSALQLRYLQTLSTIAAEKNSTIIFPLPIDVMTHFMRKWLIGDAQVRSSSGVIWNGGILGRGTFLWSHVRDNAWLLYGWHSIFFFFRLITTFVVYVVKMWTGSGYISLAPCEINSHVQDNAWYARPADGWNRKWFLEFARLYVATIML